jgi:hypothetical protein
MKTSIPPILITFSLVCFALVQNTQAISPPPDGGYPGGNTAEGQNALLSLTGGTYNTAVGLFSLSGLTDGAFNTGVGAGTLLANKADENTATGAAALLSNNMGHGNTASGAFSLFRNTVGDDNIAYGDSALFGNDCGNSNTAIGVVSLYFNMCGSGNIALGASAGYLVNGDNNIDIGNPGNSFESNTIRIGDPSVAQFTTYIAGITGTAVVGDAVVVDGNGQLGTVASAARFKKEIRRMDKASEAILALKPVSFQYKSDTKGTPQFGLIAEEVAKVNPDLVVRDRNGEIYSVRYEAVNAMLPNEFLKAHQKMEEQGATIAKQQKQIEALTEGLQKVGAPLEASKRAPQVVNNP